MKNIGSYRRIIRQFIVLRSRKLTSLTVPCLLIFQDSQLVAKFVSLGLSLIK